MDLASWPLPAYAALVGTSTPYDYWDDLQASEGQYLAVTDVATAATGGVVSLAFRSRLEVPWVLYGLAPTTTPTLDGGHVIPWPSVSDDAFHHYGMVLDLVGQTASLWVDGVLVRTQAIDFDVRTTPFDEHGQASTWCAYVPGPTMDLAVYDRAVTEAELLAQTAGQRGPHEALTVELGPTRETRTLWPERATTWLID